MLSERHKQDLVVKIAGYFVPGRGDVLIFLHGHERKGLHHDPLHEGSFIMKVKKH